MITLPGDKMCQRVAYSLVNTLGMPQMAVKTLAEYEDYAIRLATHPQELQSLRNELHQKKRSSPLFNTQLWTRHFEHSLWAVWKLYAAGHSPTEMVIPAIESQGTHVGDVSENEKTMVTKANQPKDSETVAVPDDGISSSRLIEVNA